MKAQNKRMQLTKAHGRQDIVRLGSKHSLRSHEQRRLVKVGQNREEDVS